MFRLEHKLFINEADAGEVWELLFIFDSLHELFLHQQSAKVLRGDNLGLHCFDPQRQSLPIETVEQRINVILRKKEIIRVGTLILEHQFNAYVVSG